MGDPLRIFACTGGKPRWNSLARSLSQLCARLTRTWYDVHPEQLASFSVRRSRCPRPFCGWIYMLLVETSNAMPPTTAPARFWQNNDSEYYTVAAWQCAAVARVLVCGPSFPSSFSENLLAPSLVEHSPDRLIISWTLPTLCGT